MQQNAEMFYKWYPKPGFCPEDLFLTLQHLFPLFQDVCSGKNSEIKHQCYSKSNHLKNLHPFYNDCLEKWKPHTIGFLVLRISNSLFDWLSPNWLFSPCWTTCPLGKTAWEIVSKAFGTHSFFHPNFQLSLKVIHLATSHLLGCRLFRTKGWSPLLLLKPLQSGTPAAYSKSNCLTNHFHSFNPWAFSFQHQTGVRMFASIL